MTAAEQHHMAATKARLGGYLGTGVVCSLAEQRHDALPGRLGCAHHICLRGARLLHRTAATHGPEWDASGTDLE